MILDGGVISDADDVSGKGSQRSQEVMFEGLGFSRNAKFGFSEMA